MSFLKGPVRSTEVPSAEILSNVFLSKEEEAEALRRAKIQKYWDNWEESQKQLKADVVAECVRPWSWQDQYRYLQVRCVELGIPNEVFNRIFEQNPNVVDLLCKYFTADPSFEHQADAQGTQYLLAKGIWLFGDVGTGKTTLMKLFARNKRHCFDMVECRAVEHHFEKDGTSALEVLSLNRPEPKDLKYFFHQVIGKCYDDIGTEEPVAMCYGKRSNVMAEIILNRYHRRSTIPFFSGHITTNRGKSYVSDTYGTRVWDRIRDMFNVIVMEGGSLRG